ncbi:hypothetical protein [Nonomuraea dietziae]|uniref:hypothetical protein n=1 Tax=Nonomuraea dietziae TaxID=65515 RepID=UPI0031D5E8EA
MEVRELLTRATAASVRLVLTPDSPWFLAEARRTLTSLNLYGYRVDAVIATGSSLGGRRTSAAQWVEAQGRLLAEAEESFAHAARSTSCRTCGASPSAPSTRSPLVGESLVRDGEIPSPSPPSRRR